MTLKLGLMRWLATLVGMQLLCGIAWVLGPLWPPLEPWPARLALIMGLVLLWAAANLLLDLRGTRRDLALARGAAAGAEAGAVGAKLAEALALMRQAKGRRFHLYEQPWYAIIGPPGAGKTTALLNAGLTFPLAGALGPGTTSAAVAGVGGTRLCDWWFTDDAVLIDTAGRYTTQDSDRDVDRTGWETFLDLLRRTRPRQPLNGVIVAIALNDIALHDGTRHDGTRHDGTLSDTTGAPAQATAHARAIRARIEELQAKLGVRLPVYALFTKADLLIGFSEFFDDLDRAGREQVWGATLKLEAGGAPTMADPAVVLRPLLDRLGRRMFRRLDAEANPDRRALIAGFPAQLASIMAPLQAFVAGAFGPDAAGNAPLLRGLYLTSATQDGTPTDRLMGALSRSFGLDQRHANRLRPEAGRAYFLASVLRDVVFREAALVGHRPGAARRRQVLRFTGFAACAALALAGAGYVLTQFGPHQAAVTRAQAAIAAQQAMVAELPLDPVADDEVALLAPWLDAAAADQRRPQGGPGRDAPAHDVLGTALGQDILGFSQDDKLDAAARAQYRHALEYGLLPRMVWRAETQVRGLLGQADALYEATRIYLMLGGAGPLDRALIQDWFNRDWAAARPGDAQAGLRASLARHLAALLDEPLPPIPLDGPLVARARETIGRVPLAARAWSRLRPLALANAPPPWRPADALGPAGVTVFIRLSGRGLEDGIPGLYSVEGLRTGILPALSHAADAAAAESWVSGQAIEADGPLRRTLEADILALYAAEYAAAWDAMLSDLDPAPLRSLTQAAQDLYILASANSPIRTLLRSAAAQLAPAQLAQAQLAPAAAMKMPALGVVDQQFQPLLALFGTGGAAPIDSLLRPLSDLQQQLAKQAASATRLPTPSPADDPATALRAEAIRRPPPVGRWLTALATAGAALRDGGARGAMIGAWSGNGGAAGLCPAVVARYPFAPAAADASLEDFTRLFAPGGVIDAFFNGQLKPYVDTAARPWKLQAVDGVNAPVTAADLAQFQRAAAIRDLFFPGGATQPLVRFDITPGALDAGITAATLDLGTASIAAAREGPARPSALVWPGRPRATAARVTITGASPATPVLIETQGPWATFRLLAAGLSSGPTSGTPSTTGDRTALVFTKDGSTARFTLRATPNPFGNPLLAQFRCPAVQ